MKRTVDAPSPGKSVSTPRYFVAPLAGTYYCIFSLGVYYIHKSQCTSLGQGSNRKQPNRKGLY